MSNREAAVTIPDRVDARWLATLGDEQLVDVEASLHADFRQREAREKSRAGARYVLLQGPAHLVTAWHRWLLVNNETRTRGLLIRHPPR